MKKKSIIFTTLFLALPIMPVFALTVSGTVYNDEGPLDGAAVQALDSSGNKIANVGQPTNSEGKFNFSIPNNATKLQISFIGYKTQIVDAKENLAINLQANTTTLKEVAPGASRQDGDPCSGEPLTDPYADGGKGEWKKINDAWVCVPTGCKLGYELKGTKCVEIRCDETEGYEFNGNANKCEKTNCSYSEKQAIIDASGIGPKWDGKKCVPTGCASNYHLTKNKCVHDKCTRAEDDWDETQQKCVQVRCTDEQKAAINAKEGQWENGHCIATKCLDDKNFQLNNGSCNTKPCSTKELEKRNAVSGHMENGECIIDTCKKDYSKENGACVNEDILAEKRKAYEDAKANEQSTANKTLTALSTAATGIGGMELAQGLSEQSADKAAAADMAAYIETMRCTYGEGKQVKAGIEEIELPGANDQELMNLRGQYLALAQDLKERKDALGMKPGIESEEILDRSSTGIYDDENIGITGGNYASLYRAQVLESEADQEKIDDAKKTSKNRVIAGAVVGGAGVVGGVVGNSLINGKLGEKIKEKKEKNKTDKENEEIINSLKKGLKSSGMKNVDKLNLSNFDFTQIKDLISNTDFTKLNFSGQDASTAINTSNETSLTSSLENLFKTN